MPDFENVVKELECCLEHEDCNPWTNCANPCPHGCLNGGDRKCFLGLMEDVLTLIRPVKPVKSKLSWEHGYNWDIWDCGYCGSQLRSGANYCDQCGHKVDWDDVKESEA